MVKLYRGKNAALNAAQAYQRKHGGVIYDDCQLEYDRNTYAELFGEKNADNPTLGQSVMVITKGGMDDPQEYENFYYTVLASADNIIDLYTLAEKEILMAHLKNAIRWSPWPTYGLFSEFSPAGRDVDREIMERAYGEGITVRVERLFKPIRESRYDQYNRHYVDDAFRLLRLMVKECPGMLVLRDSDEMRKDLDFLKLNSPPLYDNVVALIEK